MRSALDVKSEAGSEAGAVGLSSLLVSDEVAEADDSGDECEEEEATLPQAHAAEPSQRLPGPNPSESLLGHSRIPGPSRVKTEEPLEDLMLREWTASMVEGHLAELLGAAGGPAEPSRSEEAAPATKNALRERRTLGRVVCLLCGHPSDRNHFKAHVKNLHLPKAFRCRLCDYAAANGFRVREHVTRLHPEAELAAAVEDESAPVKSSMESMIAKCFGAAWRQAKATVWCHGCSRAIRSSMSREHVTQTHLEEPCFTCGYCNFVSKAWSRTRIRAHVGTEHMGLPEAFEDHRRRLFPAIRRLTKLHLGFLCNNVRKD